MILEKIEFRITVAENNLFSYLITGGCTPKQIMVIPALSQVNLYTCFTLIIFDILSLIVPFIITYICKVVSETSRYTMAKYLLCVLTFLLSLAGVQAIQTCSFYLSIYLFGLRFVLVV